MFSVKNILQQYLYSASPAQILKSFFIFLQISASDQDGHFGQITFSILPGDDGTSFSINTTTGLITTAAQLDRETQDKYVLTVQAKDSKLKLFYLESMKDDPYWTSGRTV